MQMYQALSKAELESLMFKSTAMCLGYDAEAAETQSKIRISWPTDANASASNPGWSYGEDVVFLRITPTNETYTMLENTDYTIDENGEFVERVNVTRCYAVNWFIYGFNAMDNAYKIKRALLRTAVRRLMADKHVFVLPNIDEPIRNDELNDRQWWHRCDLTARFYEGVVVDYAAEAIAEMPNIEIRTDKAEQ